MLKTALVVSLAALMLLSCTAQTPASTELPQSIHANLNQLMQGVIYPAANVLFST